MFYEIIKRILVQYNLPFFNQKKWNGEEMEWNLDL